MTCPKPVTCVRVIANGIRGIAACYRGGLGGIHANTKITYVVGTVVVVFTIGVEQALLANSVTWIAHRRENITAYLRSSASSIKTRVELRTQVPIVTCGSIVYVHAANYRASIVRANIQVIAVSVVEYKHATTGDERIIGACDSVIARTGG